VHEIHEYGVKIVQPTVVIKTYPILN